MAFLATKKEPLKKEPSKKPIENKYYTKKEKPQEFEFAYTQNQCAKMLCKDPRTVKKRVIEADLKPAGKVAGFSVYNLSDIALLCYSGEPVLHSKYEIADLSPKERAEHFMAEKREIEVKIMKRELVYYDESAEKFADLARTFAKFFDTFADDLEQTQLFTPEQMDEIRDLSDDQRIAFHQSEF